jgi:putative flippase GtrA
MTAPTQLADPRFADAPPSLSGRARAWETRHAACGQLIRFAVVGLVNTGVFLALYLLLRTVLPATGANVVATVITTFTGTRANGRLTFAAGSVIAPRQHLRGLVVAAAGLAISTGAVASIAADNQLVELVVLTAAGAVSGLLRFVLFRHWVFADVRPHLAVVA